jgi:hypothetical protein
VWVLAVLVSLVLAAAMHGLTSDAHVVGSTESSRAEALYARVNGGSANIATDAIVVRSARWTAVDPPFDKAVTRLASRVPAQQEDLVVRGKGEQDREEGSGQFAGYSVYQFDRNSIGACNAVEVVTVGGHSLTCTGAESDSNADWPIVTTARRPVAGKGVNPKLLGTVYRRGLKEEQVTYAGKLLYLFDDQPHQFAGVNYVETVLPLPPWHGLWTLVSPRNGSEVTGSITLTTQMEPNGGSVLAADMFQGVLNIPIVVYTYSADAKDHSNCSSACALDWPPVISSEAPRISGLPTTTLGTIRRSDGQTQVTYEGHPLYFYSSEAPRLSPLTGLPLIPPTVGGGNGLAGPAHNGKFSLLAVDT